MILSNITTSYLTIDQLILEHHQSWCFYGSNSSGISEFTGIFTEEYLNTIGVDKKTSVISFEAQQQIFEDELKNDNTDFLDRIDPGTPAYTFIENSDEHQQLIAAFNLNHCMERGYRQLSSGESRKLLILAAISTSPDLLMIENPYDGLDFSGCSELDSILHFLTQRLSIVITVNNRSDIPHWITHIGIVDQGRIVDQGTKNNLLTRIRHQQDDLKPYQAELIEISDTSDQPEELISLTNGIAKYGDNQIFSGLNLTVFQGQHTLITGPNGSGKSTLLHMITGDNQNCYGNSLFLFGVRRGSGESIWEIKKHMGIVSPDLHRNHYIPGSSLQVVLSGYFDTIGVYTRYSPEQYANSIRWLEIVGLKEKVSTSFRQLTYSEQRLCLIARGLIKMPKLLLLDEPTQGLDENNRMRLLDFLATIAEKNLSTILFTSHRRDEMRPFFTQHLNLKNY